ncbi:hypothetical protein [Microvirga sp. Mcv34]|uniref:hypothetical protein n=1 Tax=Microvirga sp. Mcv34 TaxID=2926016 RepID=UPI0021C670BC|nr:hypothetical protein [Microvirga sp. Mcv34]
MSLSIDVLRLITVRAIKGRTLVGDRVLDSANLSADLAVEGDDGGVVTVYTNEASLALDGNSLTSFEGNVDLVIEISIAGRVAVRYENDNGETVEEVETVIRPTDEGLELSVGIIARQITNALLDPESPWADLWRTFAPKRDRIRIRRGESGQGAPRFASRQIVMTVDVLSDPPPGVNLDASSEWVAWKRFVDLAAEDDDLSGPAKMIRGIIENGPVPNTWEEALHAMGASGDAAASLGIANVIIPRPEDERRLEKLTLKGDRMTGPIDIGPLPPEVE